MDGRDVAKLLGIKEKSSPDDAQENGGESQTEDAAPAEAPAEQASEDGQKAEDDAAETSRSDA